MRKPIVVGLAAFTTILAGCQSQTQVLDQEQAAAVQTAVSRGQFDLSCPTAIGEVLSKNLINPAINGPLAEGVQRAEFTIGVTGCGQKQVYISVCQVGSVSCVAVKSRS